MKRKGVDGKERERGGLEPWRGKEKKREEEDDDEEEG